MIVDAHVHLFPERVFAAIWRWFDKHAWNIQYRMRAEEVVQFLVERGVARVVGLTYSHQPGMARVLNQFMAEAARAHPELIALGTVLPGEPDAEAIVAEAFRAGLRGLKLHSHVQKIAVDDPRLDPIYRACAEARLPIVFHSGNAPCLDAYGVNIHSICSVAHTRRTLERHPQLRLIVPHLGAAEITEHFALLDEFENLHLDTTMSLCGYFPEQVHPTAEQLERFAPRLLYGTDFPNLPYEWDRELRFLESQPISDGARARILGENALRLFS
jgi:predicted TIM-barrel fold metal-dependent hydrolase